MVHIPSCLSLQKFDPLFIEHFQKHVNISQPLKPLRLPLQHPCLVSTMSFLPFSVQPLERYFCIPKFFSVLSLLQLSSCWKTQIMSFVLLKVNRHFSVIISLRRHFLASALMDSPSSLKLHFPSLSGHQPIQNCLVPLWMNYLWGFSDTFFYWPSHQCLSSLRFSLVSILLWNLLCMCVLVKLHLI